MAPLPEDPGSRSLSRYWEPPSVATGAPEHVLRQVAG
jgi:hypothetical protein